MELLQLHYFCSVAKLENVSKAAQLHRIPQSAMSKTISRLEAELGVELFDRTSNSLRLNEAGFNFYWDIKEALKIISSAENNAGAGGPASVNHIKIYIDTCVDYFIPLILDYVKSSPSLSVNLSTSKNVSEAADAFDFYICEKPPPVMGYDYKEGLYSYEIQLGMSKNNPLAHKEAVSTKEIPVAKYVLYHESDLHEQVERTLLQEGCGWGLKAVGERSQDILPYVEEDIAFSFFPSIYAKSPAFQQIKLVPLTAPLGAVKVHFAARCSGHKEPIWRSFSRYLSSLL